VAAIVYAHSATGGTTLGLITELYALQDREGYCSPGGLRELARDQGVPLYRLEGLVSFYPHFRRTPPPRATVHLCRDMSCHLADRGWCKRARERLEQVEGVEVHEASCLGRCDQAPAATINEVPVCGKSPDELAELAGDLAGLPPDEPTDSPRRWRADPYPSPGERYGKLRELVARPDDDAARDEIVKTLEGSGLRGMGGAGFPTGLKWKLVRGEKAQPKYVVVNADESEPGTFKDRVILEELPHLTVEGTILGGWVVGAEKGIVYIRHEYTRERKALEAELERARAAGVLGQNVAGSGWSFDIEVFVSPGGYILGEETALLEALEDERGEPRNKPPYPGTEGLHGKPTLINNVETLAMVPAILHHKGFAPGGASSNFLRADRVDVPLDFKALQEAGSMLGSGAVVVAAEGTDMIDLGTNIVKFFRNESCGKCVPCRVGSEKAVIILERMLRGEATREEIDLIAPLADTLTQTSICGLGQVALAPILSVMELFPEDLRR
jgi:NADH:ubiquinone oxidoreductase subunit F (NADH-binding)/NADH:ubiquinone oxidoreductase subunit E